MPATLANARANITDGKTFMIVPKGPCSKWLESKNARHLISAEKKVAAAMTLQRVRYLTVTPAQSVQYGLVR